MYIEKDTIDRTHYPVFHQMEGVKILRQGEDVLADLKTTLGGLIEYLYPGRSYRFEEDYFPFTDPSLQVEVKTEEGWMEVLGGGVIHPKIFGKLWGRWNRMGIRAWYRPIINVLLRHSGHTLYMDG